MANPACPLLDDFADEPLCLVQRFADQRRVLKPTASSRTALSDQVSGVDCDLLVVVRAEGLDAAHVEVLRWRSQDPVEVVTVKAVVLGLTALRRTGRPVLGFPW